jgi:hypothetical protein
MKSMTPILENGALEIRKAKSMTPISDAVIAAYLANSLCLLNVYQSIFKFYQRKSRVYQY